MHQPHYWPKRKTNSIIRILFLTCLMVNLFSGLTGCGGGGGGEQGNGSPDNRNHISPTPTPRSLTPADPAYHLNSDRFTTHQPEVLEQIGAHHAYAKGLTGKGVRIGIEDSIVDYTQRGEFGNRVKLRNADGTELSLQRPFADQAFGEIQTCRLQNTCKVWPGNSQGDIEAPNRWVQEIVSRDGWPTRDDSVFLLDEHYNEDVVGRILFRWREVPSPYDPDQSSHHGTFVASVAAGTRLGVAPGATMIPVVRDFSNDQGAANIAEASVRAAITLLPPNIRNQYDEIQAGLIEERYKKYDIINRSFGTGIFDQSVVTSRINSALDWYRRNLPKTLEAQFQMGTPDSQKTIVVYAAGNESRDWSSLEADLPYHVPALRGHHLSVVSTDPSTGRIADYSNRCGALPPNWDATRHGRHFCLAAPGEVRGLVPDPQTPGNGKVETQPGTSYAAPLVSGSLALLKEHFRSTRGNTEIVQRMINTANRKGPYADLEIYGAGHLDLAAALAPVGPLTAGQSAQSLHLSRLQTPAAFGSLAQRIGSVELATFDEQNFPFWVPLSSLLSTRSNGQVSIPRLAETSPVLTPAIGLDALSQHWLTLSDTDHWPLLSSEPDWLMGLGPTSASLARPAQANVWGYGFSMEENGYLGAQTGGAFGSDLRSRMIWTSRVWERPLGPNWHLNAQGTLAYSQSDYADQAIFSASPAVLSAISVRLGTAQTGFTLSQPLRAESGEGIFRVENGLMKNGRRSYDRYQVPLQPPAREWRLAMRHDRKTLGGLMAIEVSHAVNAGHIPGAAETGIGFAFRRAW